MHLWVLDSNISSKVLKISNAVDAFLIRIGLVQFKFRSQLNKCVNLLTNDEQTPPSSIHPHIDDRSPPACWKKLVDICKGLF